MNAEEFLEDLLATYENAQPDDTQFAFGFFTEDKSRAYIMFAHELSTDVFIIEVKEGMVTPT